jgi:hypothetical protein
MRSGLIICVLLVALAPGGARAQTPDPPVRRLQLGAGVGFFGGAALGDVNANLRSASANDPYRVFATTSRLVNTTAIDLRAAIDLTGRFGLEAHALYGHPELRTGVVGDVENAPSVIAIERLDHYLIDGGLVIKLDELRVKGWQPFAALGAGYLRQLHEGLTVTEEGRVYYIGGGARRLLLERSSGFLRGLGARGDVRLSVLTGGITVESDARRHLSASANLFVVF